MTAGDRRATGADVDEVTAIVAPAFAPDPLWSRALAPPGGHPDSPGAPWPTAFWRLLVAGALRYPDSWLTAGGEATAVWIPPGGTDLAEDQEQSLHALVAEHLGPAADHYGALAARFDAAHPRHEPHYYLTLLATHPAHGGGGLAMALLERNLAALDAAGFPAYLESSNPANIPRYRRVGFTPVGQFSSPDGSAVVTTMWRPAGAGPTAAAD